jgi:DNA-binding CsgD family transcriptional regulator
MEASITLRTADLEAILNAAETTDRAMPDEAAIHDLLETLSALVSCDLLFWTRFDVQTPHKIAEIGYPHAPTAVGMDDWIAHRPEHPICSGLHGPVVSLSDVIDPAEFHRTWFYQTCWRPAGWEHEIGVNLKHPSDEIHDIVMSRGPGPDFDDRDHLVLRLLRPHLDAALRRLAYPTPSLTPRETQVLSHVRDGLSNTQIARALGVAESTVVKHLEHIFTRTGAHSRTQAVQLCAAALD